MMTSRQSVFPIGGEGISETTHGYILVEYHIINNNITTRTPKTNDACEPDMHYSL